MNFRIPEGLKAEPLQQQSPSEDLALAPAGDSSELQQHLQAH